jgi:hypothetical protein
MLRSVKQLYGNHLGASDGEIGQVKDFYFDDRTWAVRYVIADTGKWLPGREVLLSPHAFSSSQAAGKTMLVNLTRKQIENSPSMETHKPVSRQYEEEYHRYYGWPYYWEGDGLWGGMRGFPILEPPTGFSPAEPEVAKRQHKSADADLRSTQAVSGYHLQATDGIIGHVCDFLMDDKSWAINQLVVKTGHRFTGKEVQIPISQVERISYKESTVYAKVSQEAVEKSPEHRLIPNGMAIAAQPPLAL